MEETSTMVICHNDGMVMIFCDGTIAINGFATTEPSPLHYVAIHSIRDFKSFEK